MHITVVRKKYCQNTHKKIISIRNQSVNQNKSVNILRDENVSKFIQHQAGIEY